MFGRRIQRDKGSLEKGSSLRHLLGSAYEDPDAFLALNWPDLSRAERRSMARELKSFRDGLDGSPSGPARRFLWQLIASGLATYASSPYQGHDAEQSAVEIAACALWPLVLAGKMKEGWYESLRAMSSEEICRLVAEARVAKAMNGYLAADQFARYLTATSFASGILRLLDEMSDAQRGGAALTAISMAHSKPAPRGLSPKRLLGWVFLAAAGGIVGNRADDVATNIWDWLERDISESSGGHALSSSSDSDPWGQSNSDGRSTSGILQILDDLF